MSVNRKTGRECAKKVAVYAIGDIFRTHGRIKMAFFNQRANFCVF